MVEAIPSRRTEHRRRIVEAASEIFLEHGFEQTSTAEIAKRARVSKRELYAHFTDKGSLLAAVIVQLQEDVHLQMNVGWSSSEDVREVLTQAGIAILEFVRSKKFVRLFRIVAAQSFRDPVSAERFYVLGPRIGRQNTAAFLERAMGTGRLREADALRASSIFSTVLKPQ